MKEFIRNSDDEMDSSDDEVIINDGANIIDPLELITGADDSSDSYLDISDVLDQDTVGTSAQPLEEDDAERSPQPLEQNTPGTSNESCVTVEQGNWNFSDDSDEEETKATVEEVFEVEPVLENNRDQPPDIEVGAEIIDVKFHPSSNLIVAGTLDSEVVSYHYSKNSTTEAQSSEHHEGPLRSVCFSENGSRLFTASKDKSVGILDTETFKIVRHVKEAHETSVYSVHSINEYLFASGDDDGILKVWDMRRKKSVYEFRVGEETVNSIISDDTGKFLIAAVDDGSISAFNVQKRKLLVQSEITGSPFTCMSIVRNGTRLAVGSGSGNIYLYKWGEFGLHAETVTHQPEQINCMIAVGDNRVITGCEDKSIRAVNLFPHRFVGIVGSHGAYGVESISVSCDQRYLASCCQDDTIKFWDLKHVYSKTTNEKEKGKKELDLKNNLLSSRERNVTDFFNDMPEENHSDEEYIGPVVKPTNVED